MKILIVEDDVLLMDFVARCLVESGFDVQTAKNGEKGYKIARANQFDGIVLDINLPGMLGTDICTQLRWEGIRTPILFLSANDSKDDRVNGLNLGADDYLVKPFSHDELVARVKALSRRPNSYVHEVICYKDISIDSAKREVRVGSRLLRLTPKEFQLLEVLARNSGVVLSREYLLKHVWGVTVGNTSNRLEVCVRSLRSKLRAYSADELIGTEYGVGYKLTE